MMTRSKDYLLIVDIKVCTVREMMTNATLSVMTSSFCISEYDPRQANSEARLRIATLTISTREMTWQGAYYLCIYIEILDTSLRTKVFVSKRLSDPFYVQIIDIMTKTKPQLQS